MELYRDVWVDSPFDKHVVRECGNFGGFELTPESYVLDLGAHIGSFAAFCKRAGVAVYHGYEPRKENFQLLKKNAADGYRLYNAAVTTSYDTKVPMYVHPKNPSAMATGSVLVRKGRPPVDVQNVHVDLATNFAVTHLKMDIEGGERQLFRHWFDQKMCTWPETIVEADIEVHGQKVVEEFEAVYWPRLRMLGFEVTHIERRVRFKKVRDKAGNSITNPHTWSCMGESGNGQLLCALFHIKRSR